MFYVIKSKCMLILVLVNYGGRIGNEISDIVFARQQLLNYMAELEII